MLGGNNTGPAGPRIYAPKFGFSCMAGGIEGLWRNFESLPPLPKYHSQKARELLRNLYSI
jgi:hypothetical protein